MIVWVNPDAFAKGRWWEVFGDPALNELEEQAMAQNQSLKAALARVDQARALARVSRSEFFPNIDFDPSYARQKYSPNQDPSFGNITANTFNMPLDLSDEIDLWVGCAADLKVPVPMPRLVQRNFMACCWVCTRRSRRIISPCGTRTTSGAVCATR